jgi:hypothetical protein
MAGENGAAMCAEEVTGLGTEEAISVVAGAAREETVQGGSVESELHVGYLHGQPVSCARAAYMAPRELRAGCLHSRRGSSLRAQVATQEELVEHGMGEMDAGMKLEGGMKLSSVAGAAPGRTTTRVGATAVWTWGPPAVEIRLDKVVVEIMDGREEIKKRKNEKEKHKMKRKEKNRRKRGKKKKKGRLL